MKTKSDHSDHAHNDLSEKLEALEKRVAKLELAGTTNKIASVKDELDDNESELSLNFYEKANENIESKVGEYGLAWLGNFVLFFGLSFLVQYLQVNGYKLISTALGIGSVAIIFVIAHYLRNTSPYMAKIFNLNAYLIAFYVTLKLHFFTANPIISNKTLAIGFLLLVTSLIVSKSIFNKHKLLAGLSVLMFTVTAIISDSTHVMLSIAVMLAVVSTVLLFRFGWIRMAYLSIFLTYFIALMWIIGNPLMGHQIEMVTIHQSAYIYLYFIAIIFSLIALIPEKPDWYSSSGIVGVIVMNGLGFLFLISLFILSFFKDSYAFLTGMIAFYCIVYSVILNFRSHWKITAALFALFGFVVLSICLYGIYGFPRVYFYLAIQSFLVVSIAIWFRSKFIVIMNSILFIVLLMIYLLTSAPENEMNISFSFVALATARILNWKKERLTIQTDLIRNFYLILAYLMVLYTLYHLVPSQYITLSWTLFAAVYFGLSIVLKNVKYRYMALGTMIAATLFLFLVDLTRIELIYRVMALLFLAIISIGLSFYYAKKLKKKTSK